MSTYVSHKPEHVNEVLLDVRNGMPIYDLDNKKIGYVRYVQLPNESPDSELTYDIIYPYSLGKVDAEGRARLIREGFVQVEGGFFRPDRYILPDQILEVNKDHIVLNIVKDEIIDF